MNFARIENGIVVNIEVADQEWADAHTGDGFVYVESTQGNPAVIGLTYDSESGFFEQSPPLISSIPDQPEFEAQLNAFLSRQ